MVRWRLDDGPDAEAATEATGLGFHAAELDTSEVAVGRQIDFGWKWREGDGAVNDKVRVTVGAKTMAVEP